ncbi:Alpha/Beta hydrolase protein [Xylariaceae sp. FL0255]|nr:Alpha/Beta hydrolase protein [Xylariaceae sp. FL0255]
MTTINNEGPKITYRSDLSPLYKALRKPLHRLRSHIIRIKDNAHPPGSSPLLERPPRHIGKVTITERKIKLRPRDSSTSISSLTSNDTPAKSKSEGGEEVIWLYDFHAPTTEPRRGRRRTRRRSTSSSNSVRTDASERPHTIYYFSGGGFRQPAASEHWKFCAHLARHLAAEADNVRVTLVSYPLAPAGLALPILRRWLAWAVREAEEGGKYEYDMGLEKETMGKATKRGRGVISLVGDSAGGNIVLSLALWYADHLHLTTASHSARSSDSGSSDSLAAIPPGPTLKSVLAISPPTDMRCNNPEISRVDVRDPVLGIENAEDSAGAWSSGSDASDPYLSPSLANLSNLKASGVSVNGVIGTADVLAPDALVFMEKCKEKRIQGEWLIWEDQMHDFPLAACYGLKEGKAGRRWVVDRLHNLSS